MKALRARFAALAVAVVGALLPLDQAAACRAPPRYWPANPRVTAIVLAEALRIDDKPKQAPIDYDRVVWTADLRVTRTFRGSGVPEIVQLWQVEGTRGPCPEAYDKPQVGGWYVVYLTRERLRWRPLYAVPPEHALREDARFRAP